MLAQAQSYGAAEQRAFTAVQNAVQTEINLPETTAFAQSSIMFGDTLIKNSAYLAVAGAGIGVAGIVAPPIAPAAEPSAAFFGSAAGGLLLSGTLAQAGGNFILSLQQSNLRPTGVVVGGAILGPLMPPAIGPAIDPTNPTLNGTINGTLNYFQQQR